MLVTANGTQFVAGFEGFASRAYRCPAGVITIGFGFTMASKVFAGWWRQRHGRALQMGDTMTRAEATAVLASVLNNEYGAAVDRKIATTVPAQHDGATSTAFNCGIGSLGWRWAQALAKGQVSESARLLRTTAVTANGRRLNGLVRRREAEATLISTGNYGRAIVADLTPPSVSTSSEDVRWYQQALKTLGYAVDVNGNAKSSDAGVRTFQSRNGLKPDGIVGPATRATIIRALDAKTAAARTVQGGGAGAAGGAGVETATTPTVDPNALPPIIDRNGNPIDPSSAATDVLVTALMWGAGIAVVVGLAYLVWRYRGAFTGRRVPT